MLPSDPDQTQPQTGQCLAATQSTPSQDPRDVEARHPALVGKKVDQAIAGRIFPAHCQPRVIAGPLLEESADRPRVSSVQTRPDRNIVTLVSTSRSTE